jgi:hypothetical protein
MLFHIYYGSQENGEYLRHVVAESGAGVVGQAQSLAQLYGRELTGPDVVLVEYQEDNQELDHWLKETAAAPRGPEVFLFFPRLSAKNLFKALALGVKECFGFPLSKCEIREAAERLAAEPVYLGGLPGPPDFDYLPAMA